jgi:hypothetical protein
MAFYRIGLQHRLDDYPRASDRPGRERSTARSAPGADARRVDVLVAALAVTSIVGMSVLEGYGDIAAVVVGLFSAVLGLRLGVLKAHPVEQSYHAGERQGAPSRDRWRRQAPQVQRRDQVPPALWTASLEWFMRSFPAGDLTTGRP